MGGDLVEGDLDGFHRGPGGELGNPRLEAAGADRDSVRDPDQLCVGELDARTLGTVVQQDLVAGRRQLCLLYTSDAADEGVEGEVAGGGGGG